MAATTQTFRTVLHQQGNNVGIVVPPDVVEAFDRGKRVPVVVTIDGGFTYRSTIASMGGQLLIPLSAARRDEAGVGGGDEVEIRLDVDDAPRTVEPPDELGAALDAAGLRAAWEALSPSRQRAHAESVAGAKKPETRARRVDKVVADLSD